MREPEGAWVLPESSDIPIKAAAMAHALARLDAGVPRDRAYFRCRRWHKRWRGEMFTANGHVYMDCTRCGMRWIW